MCRSLASAVRKQTKTTFFFHLNGKIPHHLPDGLRGVFIVQSSLSTFLPRPQKGKGSHCSSLTKVFFKGPGRKKINLETTGEITDLHKAHVFDCQVW